MAERYYSIEIQEVSSRGTLLKKGIFPMSAVASMQEASAACVLAAIMESVHCLQTGVITDLQVSASMPYAIELNVTERRLASKVDNNKMSNGWNRQFYAPAVKGDV